MQANTPVLYQSLDEAYIAQCLSLAELAQGATSPNPMVGAIVLDTQGRKVGEGFHPKAGEPHAEIFALDQAGDRAKGGTLYTNLEPCNHQGRTPACTQRIIQSGIERVVCGTLDPNPLVSGSGRDTLQNARISVRHGFLEQQCRELNEVYFHHITTRMPFVSVKMGLTMDGKIATRQGESRWITGDFSRQMVHHLRHQHDAVLTTADTIIADDPQLSVRKLPNIRRQPLQLVLDRRFRLNVDQYSLFKTDQPTWIITSKLEHNPANAQRARQRGIQVLEVDENGQKLNLRQTFALLSEKDITNIMVEAGGRLCGNLLEEGLTNKLYLFYAPKILPDPMAKTGFGGALQLDLPQAPQLEIRRMRQLDRDVLIEAYPLKRNLKPAG